MTKILMRGNEVIGEAAIKAGCRFFFGYPITPLPPRMSYRNICPKDFLRSAVFFCRLRMKFRQSIWFMVLQEQVLE